MKNIERELAESKFRLNQAEKIAGMGNFTWVVETGQVTWSEGMYHLLGYEISEKIDYDLVNQQIHHPEDLQRVTQWLNDSIKSKKNILPSNKYRLIRKNEEVIHVSTTGIIKRSAGYITVFATVQDISERIENEERLHSINQQLRAEEQELKAANQQLAANEQQLRASNQQLAATEQQIRAANQQLIASEQQLRASKAELKIQLEKSEKQRKANLIVLNDLNKTTSQLRIERDKAQRILDIAAVILLIIEKDGSVSMINQKGTKILGYEHDEIIGKNWFDHFLPNSNKAKVKKLFNKIIKGDLKNLETFENEIVTREGQKRIISWHNTILKDDAGKITGTLSSGNDITENKLAEEARHKIEERFRIAQEMSPDGFTILQPVKNNKGQIIDFIWVYENAAVAKMNGTDPHKVIGQSLLKFFPGHRNSQFFKSYIKVAETGKSLTFEQAYEGESIKNKTWFRIVVVPMDENIAILAQDISRQKQTQNEIEQYKNHLEKLVKERTLKLEEQKKELERYNNLFIGREFRIKELRDEVKKLKSEMQTLKNNE